MSSNNDDGPADAVASGAKFVLEPKEVDVLCGRGGMSNHHPGNEWYRRLIRSNRPLYRACPKHTKLLVSKAIVQAVEQQGGRFLEKSRATGYWCAVAYKRSVDKTSQGLRERDKEDEEALNNMNSNGNSNNGQQNGGGPGTEGHVPASWTAAVTGGINGAPNLNDLAVVAVAQANLSNKGIGAGIPPNRPPPKRPAGSATLIGSSNEGPLKKRARTTSDQHPNQNPNNHIHTHNNNNNNANRAFPQLPQLPQQLQQQIRQQQQQQQLMQHAHPPTAARHQSSMFGLFPHAGLMQRNDTSGWSDRALAAPPPPPPPPQSSGLAQRATSRGNPVVLPTQLNNLQLDNSKAPLKVPPRKKGYMANTPSGVLGQAANTQAQAQAQTQAPRPGLPQQPQFTAAGSQQQPPFAAAGSQQQPSFPAAGAQQQPAFAAAGAQQRPAFAAAAGPMSAFRGGPQGRYPPQYGPSTSFGRGLPPLGFGGPGRLGAYAGPPYAGMPAMGDLTGGGTSGVAGAAAVAPPGASPPPALSRLTSQVSDWLCNSFWPIHSRQHQQQQLQQQQQQQQQLAMNNHQSQQQQQQQQQQHQQLAFQNHQTQTTAASSSSSSFATPSSTPPPPPPSRWAAVEQAAAAAARIPPLSKKVAKKAAKKSAPLPAPPVVTLSPPNPDPTIEITKGPPPVQHYHHQPTQSRKRQPKQRKQQQHQPQEKRQQHQQQQQEELPPQPVRNSPGKRKSRSLLPQLPYETATYPPPMPNAVEVGYPPASSIEDEYYDADTGEMEGSSYAQDATDVSSSTRQESGETYEARGEAEQNDMPTELEQSVSATLLKLAGAPSKLFSGISSLFERSETIGENGSECTDYTLKDTHANTSTNPSVQAPPEGRPKPSLLDDYEESPMEARLRTVRWS